MDARTYIVMEDSVVTIDWSLHCEVSEGESQLWFDWSDPDANQESVVVFDFEPMKDGECYA